MMIGSVTMKNFDPAAVVGEHDKHRAPDAAGDLGSLLKKGSAQSSARYWLPFFINLLKISDIAVLLLAGFGGFFVRFGLDAGRPPLYLPEHARHHRVAALRASLS
jgi:hypothetical protein